MLRNILITADDIEQSIQFYKELFGLCVRLRQEGNVILSEGLVLQDSQLWKETLDEPVVPYNNMAELYFEAANIEELLAKYESGDYKVKYLTPLTELEGNQKMVRFYDPSGNLIEVRTPVNYRGEKRKVSP